MVISTPLNLDAEYRHDSDVGTSAENLLTHFDRIADAPDAVPRLRCFILDLAIRGKLVAQDPGDEPASELLGRIAVEKAKLVREGKTKPTGAQTSDSPHFPFELPDGWHGISLGEICSKTGSGSTPRGGKSAYRKEGVIFLRSQNVYDDGLRVDDVAHIDAATHQRMSGTAVRPADLLLNITGGSIGRCCRVPDHFCEANVSQHVAIVRLAIDGPQDFVHLLIRSPYFQTFIFDEQTGAGRGGLPKNRMDRIPVPFPPLAEQLRIVAKVDEVMALCDRLEAARMDRETTRYRLAAASLARLNTPDPDPALFRKDAAFALGNLTPLTTRPDQIKVLRQTILNLAVCGKLVPQDPNDEPASELLERIAVERNDLVRQKFTRRETSLAEINKDELPFNGPSGWEWSRIGDAVLFTQYGTSTKAYPIQNGVPVLTMGNIHDGLVVSGSEKKIPPTAEELPGLYLKRFDLLYNRTNSAELVGKTGIYLGEDDCRTFASYLIRVRASAQNLSPHFLNLAMNTSEFRDSQIVPLIRKQTGQANVNGTALRHMLVPVPPLAEQRRIVAKVDELMALCDRLEASLTSSFEIRGRLLESALHEALEMTTGV